jgi:hypothetical protein
VKARVLRENEVERFLQAFLNNLVEGEGKKIKIEGRLNFFIFEQRFEEL